MGESHHHGEICGKRQHWFSPAITTPKMWANISHWYISPDWIYQGPVADYAASRNLGPFQRRIIYARQSSKGPFSFAQNSKGWMHTKCTVGPAALLIKNILIQAGHVVKNMLSAIIVKISQFSATFYCSQLCSVYCGLHFIFCCVRKKMREREWLLLLHNQRKWRFFLAR